MLKYFRNITVSEQKPAAAALFFILAAWLLFFLAVPPFENPDEDGDYAYIQSLANGIYPVLTHGETPDKEISGIEAQLQSAFRSYQIRFKQDRIFNAQPRAIDETKPDYSETSIQAYHPPVYFATAALLYWCARTAGLSAVAVFYVTKLASLFFYLVFVANFWFLLRTILARREAYYLTLAAALQPSLLMMSTSINPEIAAIAFFTLVFSLMAISLRKGSLSLRLAALLGFLSAVAILSKVTNAILLPLALSGIAVCLKCGWQKKVRLGSAFLLTSTILVTPWLAFNLAKYGTPLPHNLSTIHAVFGSQTNPFFVLLATALDLKESILSVPGVFG